MKSARNDKVDKAVEREKNQADSEKGVPGEQVADNGAASGEKKAKDAPEAGAEDLYRYEEPTVEEESYAWTIIKTLIVIGMLVGGFYYFFRFVTRRAGIQLPGGAGVQTLLVSPMGPNKFLQVVDLAGRVLVLGVTDSSINLIMEIKEKDEVDRIRLISTKSPSAQPGGFHEFLTTQLGKIIKKTMPSSRERGHFSARTDEGRSDRIDYIVRQRERLKKLNGMNDEE
ncbi:MAG TPA: flagellar biosynthetic protein FliO [Spirochaetota bacterium]|nr:flagellar biosynthetic protein FliO [Spirochaetota bacterium]